MDPPPKKLKLNNDISTKSFKLESFEDLVEISQKSQKCLLSLYPNINISKFQNTYSELLKTCSENYIKNYLILNSLSEEQKVIFLNLHSLFKNSDSNGSISCIDASPGTGKTFIISALVLTYFKDSVYIVYTNKLANQMKKINKVTSITCCKFLMDILDINYYKSKSLWSCTKDDKVLTLNEKCEEIIQMVDEIPKYIVDHKLYILDEDSVVSPWFIFFLFCFSRKFKVHILFIGDRYQQTSINKTIHHSASNYSLIKTLSKENTFFLKHRIRQTKDVEFQHILEEINSIFIDSKLEKECPMTFDIKYKIFTLLRPHFFKKEKFTTTFMSQYHANIKDRLVRYEAYLNKNNIQYSKSYLTIKDKNGEFIENKLPNDGKFLPYLILIEGEKYIYSESEHVQYYVILKSINKDSLILHNEDKKQVLKIHRKIIDAKLFNEEFIAWVKTKTSKTLYQFPIKHKTSTYHAAQGLTIKTDVLDLDLDTSSLNSFYVGLTRVKNQSQINKIHTKDLVNFTITFNKNDEYYYKYSPFMNSNITTAKYDLCKSVSVFSNNNQYKNRKILKSYFNYKNNDIQKTNLNSIVERLFKINQTEYCNIQENLKNLHND